jgi:branched-chain amino acid aminotransferase
MFVVLKNGQGQLEVVTPPLQDIILPGVTRDSILTLLREHAEGKTELPGLPKEIVISEREIGMKEVEDAQKSGNLVEMFGSGTAALVSPVDKCVPKPLRLDPFVRTLTPPFATAPT